MKFVGDRHRRKEDPRLLTGRGRYVGDIALPSAGQWTFKFTARTSDIDQQTLTMTANIS